VSYTDSIIILRGHLEELREALYAATNHAVAEDEVRRWRNVGGAHTPSHLASRLENALDRVEGYLKEIPDDLPEE
jgi:hypothetical protein